MLGFKKQIKIDPMSSPLELLINNEKTIRKDNNIHSNSSNSVGSDKADSGAKKKGDKPKAPSVKEEKHSSKPKDFPEPTEKDKKEATYAAVKDEAKAETQNQQKLDGLLENSKSVLFATKNIIPLLRDEIIIDTGKVTIIYRPFFFSEKIHSVSIQDITDIYIETAPFFATIKIIDRDFVDNNEQMRTPISVRYVWKSNAEKARRIITGLMTASKEGIDLKAISDDDLAKKLEEIGKVKETKTSVS